MVSTCIERTAALTPPQREAVEGLVELVAQHDGVRPLNEQAMFALAGRGHAVHWLAWRGSELVGYAQADRDEHSVQLFVHPGHRRRPSGAGPRCCCCRAALATASPISPGQSAAA